MTSEHDTWSARCVESRTPGEAGGPGKRIGRKASTAPRPDPTTDSPMTMLVAESQHRGHAIVEQVHADLKNGPLAALPSGSFAANSAWLVLAAIAFNLTRAAGALASVVHAKATTATVRAQLICVPARLASSARRMVLHLPRDWPWEPAWQQLFAAAHAPPVAA